MAEQQQQSATQPDSAKRDREIEVAWIDGPSVHNATIVLSEYDLAWPAMYAAQERRIRAALGERVRLLEHAGSTSVPGLVAKPRIDVILAVADSADEAAYVPDMDTAGYDLRVREPNWFEHRLFNALDVAANIHVFSAGCAEIDRMLRFRDWLRTHPEDRDRYAATKRELAQRTWQYVQHYADAKSAVVAEIMARADAAGS